ncbi:hypothetical protein DQ244_08095 [Blastococcus sp. TBT05-19]|nr:hypothetical protein DQ244_08095 [Blastococcus sp. TBT05-19]
MGSSGAGFRAGALWGAAFRVRVAVVFVLRLLVLRRRPGMLRCSPSFPGTVSRGTDGASGGIAG